MDAEVVSLRQALRADGHPAVRASVAAEGDAKSDLAIALGELTITFGPAVELLPAIIDVVRRWVGGQATRSVEVTLDGDTIKLDQATEAQQDRLVEVFVDRHLPPRP